MHKARWYYRNGPDRVGPFSREELNSLHIKGIISLTTLVTHEGATAWFSFEELAAHESATSDKARWYSWRRARRHLGSSFGLILGFLMFAVGTNQLLKMGEGTGLITGPIIVLGALAYRSAKKRRLGEAKSNLARKLIEAALMLAVCFLAFAQNDLKQRIETEPFSYLIIPLWVIVAYLVVVFWPSKLAQDIRQPSPGRNAVDRTEWYVHDDAGQRGPLKKPEVAALLRQGLLGPQSQVWRQGFTAWVPIEQVEEFASSTFLSSEVDQGSIKQRRPGARGAFIGRHWRGELSLPRSYWLNLILITVFVSIIALLSEALPSPTDYPAAYASFWIGFWVLLGLAQIWWIVGVWKSASRYSVENSKRYWGEVAKVVMVLSALSTIGTFTTQGLPQMSEFVAVIKTYNSKPAYSLRILRDASELEITGPLDFGITRAVANLLSDHPTIRTIHLNSDGGRLAEADALKNLILKLQLNTYVARNCASACVTVFVAGANRWLSRNAQIGLHSPYFPGSTEEDIKAAAESAKAFFYSRNIASDLIERGFNTPANEMWVPDHTTIFASNLATSYATERDVAASGITLHELDELETQLLKVSLFAAIKASYPDDYRMVIEQMRKGYLQGRDLADLRLSVLPTITKLYEKALPTASDSAMLAFWELLLEQALILRDISSNQCEAYLKGDSGKFDVNGIPASLLQKEMEVGAALLRSRGTYSGEMISDLMAQDAYLKLFEAMNKKYGVSTEQLLRGMEFKSTAEENCNMMLLLIREGLQLDLPDRLIVFRSMAQEAGRQP